MELLISARSRENDTVSRTQCTLNESLTLGRGPESPLLLDGVGISREHLRLHSENDRLLVTDLSSNGTWVNSQRLTRGEPHPVMPSDAIQIPGFEIRVEFPPAGEVADQLIQPATMTAPELAAKGQQAPAPVQSRLRFGASLSLLEILLIAIAVMTLVLAVLYITA